MISLKKICSFKTSNKKRLKEAKDQLVVKIISKSEILDHLIIMAAIQKKFGVIPEEIKVYKKIYLNGVIYTSSKLNTKYCDSFFYNY